MNLHQWVVLIAGITLWHGLVLRCAQSRSATTINCGWSAASLCDARSRLPYVSAVMTRTWPCSGLCHASDAVADGLDAASASGELSEVLGTAHARGRQRIARWVCANRRRRSRQARTKSAYLLDGRMQRCHATGELDGRRATECLSAIRPAQAPADSLSVKLFLEAASIVRLDVSGSARRVTTDNK